MFVVERLEPRQELLCPRVTCFFFLVYLIVSFSVLTPELPGLVQLMSSINEEGSPVGFIVKALFGG